MEVSEYHKDVDTTHVHVEYFYSKSCVVKHLLTEFDYKTRLGDVVST